MSESENTGTSVAHLYTAPSDPPKSLQPEKPPTVTLAELLQDVPLHSPRTVEHLFSQPEYGNIEIPKTASFHCDHQKCEGLRRHQLGDNQHFKIDDLHYYFFEFACLNCLVLAKVFGLTAKPKQENHFSGVCTKIYQEPPFGNPIPRRLFQIIGEANREHFLQARRAIARGLGIGAFAYYRRIVENTKFDLVGAVLIIAQATNSQADQIELLQKAQLEKQFSKAIETLREKAAIPAVLLIDGHNPLALLHDALSEGIHKLDDQECLVRAKEAEVILCEIADRMQTALTERKTVKAALTSIMSRKAAGSATSPRRQ